MSDTTSTSKSESFSLAFWASKAPALFQENYQIDHNNIWENIKKDLLDASMPGNPDFDKILTLSPKLEIFRTLYNPHKDQLELVITVLLRLLLEEKTTNIKRLKIINMITRTMKNHEFDNLRINWKSVYNLLDEISFSPKNNSQFGSGYHTDVQKSLPNFTRKLRILYPEEAVGEVLKLVRQNVQPFFPFVAKGVCFLVIFFNSANKFSTENYDRWIPELFEIWSWKNNLAWDKAFLSIFSRIASKQHDIDWSPYYPQLFKTILKLMTNIFPKKVATNVENYLQINNKYFNFYPIAHQNTYIARLLVKLIRPKTFTYAEQYWENFERIYKVTLPFLHPENQGIWTTTLAEFYGTFCKLYIDRYQREQKSLKEKQKSMNNDTEAISQINQEGDSEEQENYGEGDHFLDESCHHKFIEIMSFVIKNLLYSRNDSVAASVGIMCRRLILFKAETFAPMILNIIYSSFEQSDLSYTGFIRVFTFIAYPLLSRDNYKPGLYQLPKILEMTLDHLTSYDLKKTNLLLEFYEAVFKVVPIYHLDDLRKIYETHYGEKDDKAIKEFLNKDEDFDMWTLTEDLSDWAVRFFRRFLEILPLLEKAPAKPLPGPKSLFSIQNKFHSFICQSSPLLLETYADILCNYLQENVQTFPSQYLSDIINPLNIAAPGLIAKKLISVMKNRLLSKLTKPKPEEYSKKPLYHLVEKSNVSKIFDAYELATHNKDILLGTLNIIRDLVTYSTSSILDYTEDLELIIYHILLHDENAVFDKAVDILYKLLLSLVSIYPTNLGSQNPNDLTKEEFLNFYKKTDKPESKNLEIIWHQPDEREKEYILKLFSQLFEANIAWLSNKYIKNTESQELNYDSISRLLDDVHLKSIESSQFERKEIGRSLLIAYHTFLAISHRASFGQVAKLEDYQTEFESRLCFKEFGKAREDIYKFVTKFVFFACSSSCINDLTIGKTLIQLLLAASFGTSENYKFDDAGNYLDNFSKNFDVNDSKQSYDNRYLLCMNAYLWLQKKIFEFHLSLDFSKNIPDLSLILWLFSFHPNSTVSHLAYSRIYNISSGPETPIKTKALTQLAVFTERFVRERFAFLKENAKKLEEDGVVEFNHNKIVKTNKDTYIGVLRTGLSRNFEGLYIFLSKHLELIYPHIETLMNNPKADDITSMNDFVRILKCIDLSHYKIELANETMKECSASILKSNELFKAFETEQQQLPNDGKKINENTSHFLLHSEKQMEKCISIIGQEDIHWKIRLVNAILGMMVSQFIEPTSDLYLKFVRAVFKQNSSDHYYLRFFARTTFRILMKRLPKEFPKCTAVKKDGQEFEGVKLSLEEAIKHRFLLKSDYEKYYIKDSFTGYFDTYEKLEVRQLSNKLVIEIPQDMKDQVLQKEFFDKMFANMVSEVPAKDDANGKSNTGFDFKGTIKNFFEKKNKYMLKNPLKTIPPRINGPFLSSIFKYFGDVMVFNISFESIREIALDYDSRPKQFVASRYLYAVMKNFIHWDKEAAEDALNKTAELFMNAIDNVSNDNSGTWMWDFIFASFRTDYRLLKPFFDKILNCSFEKKNPNIQVRYMALFGYMVQFNGRLYEEAAQKLQDLAYEFRPTTVTQVTEYNKSLIILLKYYIMLPLNYKKLKNENIVEDIDTVIQRNPDKYYVENDGLLYCLDKRFIATVDRFIANFKEETSPNQKENDFQVLVNLMYFFYCEKISCALFLHFENLFAFFLELNTKESTLLSPKSIQTHTNYIVGLSKIAYPEKAIPKVLSIIENCLKSPSYFVRKNALDFYHYFHFNHVCHLKDKSISLVAESLMDKNPTVGSLAFDTLVDLLKINTKEEINREINTAKQLIQNYDHSTTEQTKGLFLLMAILLSHPYEIEEWTEELLAILLQTKKQKIVNEKFNKDFVVKFRDQHKGVANLNQRTLSYEIISDLREINNPYSYFV